MCACMYACVLSYVPSSYSHISVHIFNVTEQKRLPHNKYELNVHYAIEAYRPKIFACVCQTQPTVVSTSHVTAMFRPAINVPFKCHICQLLMCIYDNYVSLHISYELTAINNA